MRKESLPNLGKSCPVQLGLPGTRVAMQLQEFLSPVRVMSGLGPQLKVPPGQEPQPDKEIQEYSVVDYSYLSKVSPTETALSTLERPYKLRGKQCKPDPNN